MCRLRIGGIALSLAVAVACTAGPPPQPARTPTDTPTEIAKVEAWVGSIRCVEGADASGFDLTASEMQVRDDSERLIAQENPDIGPRLLEEIDTVGMPCRVLHTRFIFNDLPASLSYQFALVTSDGNAYPQVTAFSEEGLRADDFMLGFFMDSRGGLVIDSRFRQNSD